MAKIKPRVVLLKQGGQTKNKIKANVADQIKRNSAVEKNFFISMWAFKGLKLEQQGSK